MTTKIPRLFSRLFKSAILTLSLEFLEYHPKLIKAIVQSIASITITTINSTRVKPIFLELRCDKLLSRQPCIYTILFLIYFICFFF